MNEHYFTAESATDAARHPLRVQLAGQERQLVSAASVFSGHSLDLATRVLLDRRELLTPLPQAPQILDLGCGWGPIALTAALEHPDAQVWAVDVSARARELTAENARILGLDQVQVLAPEEVPEDLQVDAIWSNPPIRIGKAALHELLLTWIARLRPTGTAALVVGKNLGADPLMRWLSDELPERDVRRVASAKGYRIIEVGPQS